MPDSRDDLIIAIRYALLKKGTKQKFSLLFLIILSIVIITLDKFSAPGVSTARTVLNDFVYHVSIISSQPEKLTSFVIKETKLHYSTMHENKNLREEIEFLKQQKFNNAYLSSENQLLKDALNLSNSKSFENDFSISAKIILDQESPFLKSVLIKQIRQV